MNRLLGPVLLLLLMTSDSFALPDDLERGTATAIAQGPEGFLWIGTQNGLYRFDGHELVGYRPGSPDAPDESGLANAYITTTLTTSDGRLFVGTRRRGLFVYDELSRSFHGVDLDLEGKDRPLHITAICEGHAVGVPGVWIGTAGNGLVLLGRDDKVARQYLYAPFDPRALPSNYVTSIVQVPDGRIWVGTIDRGIGVLDPEREQFDLIQSQFGNSGSLPSNSISALTLVGEQQVWVGTRDAGVALAGVADGNLIFSPPPHYRDEHSDAHVTAICATREGEVWVATDGGGVLAFSDRSVNPIRHNASTGLGSSRAVSLYEDRSGLLWIGLFGAGLRVFATTHANFDTPPCVAGTAGSPIIVWALAEASDGSIWIGTDGSGLLRWDRTENLCQPVPLAMPGRSATDSPRIYAVEADHRGRVWVGFADHGIVALDESGVIVERLTHEANGTGLITNRILSLEAARDGALWVGTDGSGLFRVGPAGEVHSFASAGSQGYPGGMVVYEIVETPDRHVWVGSGAGDLYEYDPEDNRFTLHEISSGGVRPIVWSIVPDTDGSLWLGTDGSGVMRFAPETGEIDHLRETLTARRVYSAIPDGRGTVWASTDDGLYSIDGSRSTRNYLERDGLPTREFSFNASLAGSDGSIYFGGVGGVTRLDPDTVQRNSYTPPLVCTSITVPSSGAQLFASRRAAAEPGEPTREVILPSTVRQIAVTVAALDFAAPDRIWYRAQLSGRDHQWVETGSRRTLLYTDLRPGGHVLRVGSTRRDGAWSDQELSLLVVVEPRIWERRSSQTGAALLVALAFGLIALSVVSRQERVRAEQRLYSQTFAMVHRRMGDHTVRYGTQSAVKMAPYIESVVAELGANVVEDDGSVPNTVCTAVEDIHLASPCAAACGLVIAEFFKVQRQVRAAAGQSIGTSSPVDDSRAKTTAAHPNSNRLLVGLVRHGDSYVLTIAGSESSLGAADALTSSLEGLLAQIDGTMIVHTGDGSWFGRGFDLQVTLEATTESSSHRR